MIFPSSHQELLGPRALSSTRSSPPVIHLVSVGRPRWWAKVASRRKIYATYSYNLTPRTVCRHCHLRTLLLRRRCHFPTMHNASSEQAQQVGRGSRHSSDSDRDSVSSRTGEGGTQIPWRWREETLAEVSDFQFEFLEGVPSP
eukprot:scaffold31133_cov26-Tisochrysis_lutea.AAC.1